MPVHLRAFHGATVPLLALAGVSGTAFAQHAPVDDATVVVTAAARDADARRDIARTPGGADLIGKDEIADRFAVSLRDTLAFSPGVYAQPRFGQEVRLSIRGSGISRGFHMRGILLFQDGVPINLADNNGDFQELDPQVFERVAVYRGGNALFLGGSTLGGAIDAATPTGRSAPGVEARVDGGSFATLRAKLAFGASGPRGDAYLAVTTDRSDGDRDHARRHALRINGNVGLRLSDTIENRFYASVNHIRQELPGALTRSQALTTPRLSLPANIAQDQARDIDSIRLQDRATLDLGRGRASAGVFLNAKQLYHPIFQVIDQQSTDYGAFARVEWDGGLLSGAAGSTARFGHVAARQFVNVAGRRGAPTADARQRAQTIDSYAELRVAPWQPLTLVAGGVHTHGERTVENRLQPARSGRASFDTVSPKLGLLFTPAKDVQFFANYNRSVELPGFSELNQTPFASGGMVTPGFVAIDPQRAWTLEAGTRGTLGAVAWDVTLYRADIRGELLQFNQAPDIPAATFNAGRTRHQGVEAGLTITPARWLSLRQTYQLNDFTFRGDAQFGDNRLPVVPRHLYRGELRLGYERWSLTPALEWVPQGAWADYTNTTRTPGYVLLGLGAKARLRDRVTLFADARNIAGRRAIGDIGAAVRAVPTAALYYPVERRALYVGVRAEY